MHLTVKKKELKFLIFVLFTSFVKLSDAEVVQTYKRSKKYSFQIQQFTFHISVFIKMLTMKIA